jgi:hypothetical protein
LRTKSRVHALQLVAWHKSRITSTTQALIIGGTSAVAGAGYAKAGGSSSTVQVKRHQVASSWDIGVELCRVGWPEPFTVFSSSNLQIWRASGCRQAHPEQRQAKAAQPDLHRFAARPVSGWPLKPNHHKSEAEAIYCGWVRYAINEGTGLTAGHHAQAFHRVAAAGTKIVRISKRR